jgi:hypothetical protein
MPIIASAFPAMKQGGRRRRSWREWHCRDLTSPHTHSLRVVEKWKLEWW